MKLDVEANTLPVTPSAIVPKAFSFTSGGGGGGSTVTILQPSDPAIANSKTIAGAVTIPANSTVPVDSFFISPVGGKHLICIVNVVFSYAGTALTPASLGKVSFVLKMGATEVLRFATDGIAGTVCTPFALIASTGGAFTCELSVETLGRGITLTSAAFCVMEA